MHESIPITIFLYLKNVERGELICQQGVSWCEHCEELQMSNQQSYLDEYNHIFCFITYFEGYLQKKKNLRTFKEKLQKKVTKMRLVIIPIQPDLPGLEFIKRNFSRKWLGIVAKVVVSDCSFLFGCVFWCFFFKTLMSYRLTSELFWLRNWQNSKVISTHPFQGGTLIWPLT